MSETFFGVSLSHIMRTEGVKKIFFDTLVFSGHPRGGVSDRVGYVPGRLEDSSNKGLKLTGNIEG